MGKTAFYGSIQSGDQETISRLLSAWMKTDQLDIKVRLGGTEFVYQDGKIYLYSHSEEAGSGYLLEGHLSGPLDEARALLERLLQLCREQNIVGRFECVQVDEDGNEISEQVYVE